MTLSQQPSSLPRSTLYRVEAIILNHRNLGEADRVLTLYSREHGKLRASVRAARKLTSRLGGHVEPLTRASLLLVRGRTLDSVTQAQTLDAFPALRTDLLSAARGMHAAALTDRFTEEQESQTAVYELLEETLRRLNAGEPGDPVLRAFEMRLLETMGYRPVLDGCASCGRSVGGNGPIVFAPAWGGLLCFDCRTGQEGAVRSVSADALQQLRLLQRRGLTATRDPSLLGPAAREVELLVRWHLQYLLEKPLETATFLDDVRTRER